MSISEGVPVKTMAEVLNLHSDWAWSFRSGEVLCIGCDWSKKIREIDPAGDTFRTHQAEMLAAAGFGDVREAKTAALEEAAREMREERHGWCLDDAGRYWIKRTLDDLDGRAATVRGEG